MGKMNGKTALRRALMNSSGRSVSAPTPLTIKNTGATRRAIVSGTDETGHHNSEVVECEIGGTAVTKTRFLSATVTIAD